MTKRIAVIIDNLEKTFSSAIKGGGSVVAKNLILELLARKDIDLTVFSGPCDVSGINFKHVLIDIPHYHKEYTEKVHEIVSKENFDKIITLNIDYPYENYFLQAQSFKHRCSNIPFLSSLIKIHLSKRKIDFQELRFKNSSLHFYAVSELVKQDYVKNLGINPDNIKVVYPGTNKFYDSYPEITQNKRVKFGIVAGSSSNKGGHKFVFALGLLRLFGFDFDAVVVAPKYDSDMLYKFLVNIFTLKNRITFLKGQLDMKTFYDSIDCLVLPSMNEAFGLVAIEAMACGKPCLISSTAGVSEIVRPKTSFIFRRDSFILYLKRLIDICNIYKKDFDLFKKYSKNAFELSKDFSWANFADKILE